jgi:hypothetical protein
VGGASTALVTAAIPSSSDGQIHACYRNTGNLFNPKGSLRAVDSDNNEACTAQETAIGLNAARTHVFSKRTLIDRDQLATVASIPEFGELSMYCNGDEFTYHNTTNQVVQYKYGFVDPNEDAQLAWPSEVDTELLGFTQNGVDHLATITTSATAANENNCQVQLQVVISQGS